MAELTLDRVYQAAHVLKQVAIKTDMVHATRIDTDCDLYLKCENLQNTGSFKLRGAYFKISTLTDEDKRKGVVACSAGNHAQGVALAASRAGTKSVIFLPAGAPISKVEHNSSRDEAAINSRFVTFRFETRNAEHIKEIREAFVEAGFHLISEYHM